MLETAAFSVLWLLPLLAVPGLLVLMYLHQRRRQQAFAAWAAQRGWTYAASDAALTALWSGQPFGVGRSRRATEVLSGTFEGMPVTSFTYRWTTGDRQRQQTETRHVVVVGLPAFLPTLEITPDGVGAKLAKAVGGQDLRFESEEFNRTWRVECRLPKFASDVVHPRLMERLLEADARGESMRIEGTAILTWAYGASNLDTLPYRIGLLLSVLRTIPRHVWLEHGYDPLVGRAPTT